MPVGDCKMVRNNNKNYRIHINVLGWHLLPPINNDHFQLIKTTCIQVKDTQWLFQCS